MEFTALLLSCVALFFTYTVFFLLAKWRNNKRKYHPVAGTVFNQLLNFNRLHDYQTDLARKYKTYRLLSLLRSEIYTSDPINVEHFLRTNFSNYGKGSYSHTILGDLFGDGIFAVDGDNWKHQRKLASFEFSTRTLRDFNTIVFKKHAVKLARIVSEAASTNKTMDIQDLLMKSTLDSIVEVGFGAELNSLDGSSEEGSRFSKAFDEASVITLWRYVDVFWKIEKFLNIGSEARLKSNLKAMDGFVYNLIRTKRAQQRVNNNDVDHKKKEDILSRFLVESEKDPDKITDKYLRDIILNFVIAGKDTTAGTLSWFFYLLCKHPLVQERIVQEVRETTSGNGEKSNTSNFAERLTSGSLDRMHYLHAALTETLRLYPAVPVDLKMTLADDTFPDGFKVKKGDLVGFQPYAMGRMKFIWGEDAEVFRPERWLRDGIFQPESPFVFTAFQAGPRICLGKEFAYRQMKIFAAVLLHLFEFKLADEKKPVNYKTMITLHIDHGLHLRAFRREDMESVET